MAINYEWDVESYSEDGVDILDHVHADKLSDLPWLVEKNEKLVLVRTTSDGHRSWAYVDPESRMLPQYFSIPASDGKYYETNVKVPQRFHREIAKVAKGEVYR